MLTAISLYHLFPNSLINLTNSIPFLRNIYSFFNGKYYFDVLYNQFFITNGLKLGYSISKELDRGVIELLGPYGLSKYLVNVSNNLAKLDTGVITTYALYITLALIYLIFLVLQPVFFYSYDTDANLTNLFFVYFFEEFRLFILIVISSLFINIF
jgi:NADH-ubiquinone oxidoreductase chain 5